MTSTLDRPVAAPSPSPRGPGARALTWTGGDRGGCPAALRRLQRGGPARVGSDDATTTSESATFAAAPVVELVADGHVTVTTGGDRVEVERTASTLLAPRSYRADQLGDRLRVSYLCDWWRPGFCSASLDVTVPDGTSVIVRASDGYVDAADLRGPLDVHVSDGEADISDIDGDVTVRSADGRVSVSDVRGSVSVRSSDGEIVVSEVSGVVTTRSSDGRTEISRASRHRRPRQRRRRDRVRHGRARRARHLHGRRRADRRGSRPTRRRSIARADRHLRRPRVLPGTTRLTPRERPLISRSADQGPFSSVGVAGFEPTTSSSRTKRATKLRHTPWSLVRIADDRAWNETGSVRWGRDECEERRFRPAREAHGRVRRRAEPGGDVHPGGPAPPGWSGRGPGQPCRPLARRVSRSQLVTRAPQSGSGQLAAVGVPGDREVDVVRVHRVEDPAVRRVRDAQVQVDRRRAGPGVVGVTGVGEPVAVEVRVVGADQRQQPAVDLEHVPTVGEVDPAG